MGKTQIDPAFEGHPEKPMRLMSAEEKRAYLSEVIELTHFLRTKAVRVSKAPANGTGLAPDSPEAGKAQEKTR